MTKKEQAFILAYLETSDEAYAYRVMTNVYNYPEDMAMAGGELILLNPAIAEVIKNIKDNVRLDVLLEYENNLPMMLTMEDKSAILAEIARGKMKAYAEGVGETCCTCGMSEYPTHDEIIVAIQKDCMPCIAKAYMMMMEQRSNK